MRNLRVTHFAGAALALAVVAAIASLLSLPGGKGNPNLWVPVASAAIPLIPPRNPSQYWISGPLMCAFVVIGATSVEMFYAPAAAVMIAAAASRSWDVIYSRPL